MRPGQADRSSPAASVSSWAGTDSSKGVSEPARSAALSAFRAWRAARLAVARSVRFLAF